MLTHDPYRVLQLPGIGFKTADRIARSLGVELDDPQRLRAGLPKKWQVADKTGSGDHGTANDIAVAWAPKGPIVMACYLTGAEKVSFAAREAAIAEVGRVIGDNFTALHG